MRNLLLLALLAAPASAFQPTPIPPPKTAKEKEIEALVSRLAALPVEVEADSLLMLIGAAQIPAAQVPAILDRLFLDTGRAIVKSPSYISYPVFENWGGNVPGISQRASQLLALDQLSLQTRIVTLIKATKLSHAVELFDTIQPAPPSRSCAAPLTPKVDRYYKTLQALFHDRERGATAKARQDAAHWLGGHLVVSQEAQIAPVAGLIMTLSSQPPIFELALSRLSQDLANLDPSFLPYLATIDAVTDALIDLAKRATLNGFSAEPLWRSFASYNRNALTGTRCGAYPAETLDKRLHAIWAKLDTIKLPPEAAEAFASLVKLEPKQVDDTKPPFESFYANKTSPWYALQIEYQNLRFGPIETRRQFVGKHRPDGLTSFIPLEERKSPAWDDRATKYLRGIEDYVKNTEEDGLTTFVKTSSLYSTFIEILPHASISFPGALSSYVAYLSAAPFANQEPLIWLFEVKAFLRHGTLDEHEQGYDLVRAAIRQQGGQILNTIIEVDRLNPIRSESNMSTLVVP